MAPVEIMRGNTVRGIVDAFNSKKEKDGWSPIGVGTDDRGFFLLIHQPLSVSPDRPKVATPRTISVVGSHSGETIVIGEEKISKVQEELAKLFFYLHSRGGPALDKHYQQALDEGMHDDLVCLFPKPYNDKMSKFYATLRQAGIRSITDLLNLTSEEMKDIKGIGDKGIVVINTIRNILLNNTP